MAVDTAMIMRHMDRLMYIPMGMGRSAAADMSTMPVNMKRHAEAAITMSRKGMGKAAIIMNMRRMTQGNTIIGMMSMGICMKMEKSAAAGMITGIRMKTEKSAVADMIMRHTLTNMQSVRWKITRSIM